ncbi:extracellular solute-binding protein [Nocardia seriolae]|uniref:ABC transporter substrate-binding protein n=1 Tax=Nocardia seriolae TaxID=37332 RepID=A0ABC9Z053_9NOCA|nr:extracellular solute-binding protein [Nocardia seriolae]BEK95094.1 ABC transporter substrate-binding protein [Nocardia seriolae]GAM49033.1 ABC transporter substrate-binding protein [Nocardia seriolae]GAP30920.1 ABC transporter substrate-binding protein [Nocardia seriolae]
MPLSRRAFVAAAVTSALATAACGRHPEPNSAPAVTSSWTAPPGLSGELTLYSANPQDLGDELLASFTKASGVKVATFNGETGRVVAKLDKEAAHPVADVVYLASWIPAAQYALDGRTLPYTPRGADRIHDGWLGKDHGFIGRDGSALTRVVNSKLSPRLPNDWADLAAPEFRGKVIMPDPRESGTARDLLAAMVSAWGKDRTWAMFDSLFGNGMTVRGGNGPALDEVTAANYAVILGGVDYAAYDAAAKGVPLRVISPASGTVITPRPVFILNTTRNPAAAKALVDYMFTPEAQRIAAAHKMIPARTDIATAPGTRAYADVKQLSFSWDFVKGSGAGVLAEFSARYLN